MKKWFACLCALLLLAGAALGEEGCAHDQGLENQGEEGHACVLCHALLPHEIIQRKVEPTCRSVGYTMDVCALCAYQGPQYDLIEPGPQWHVYGDWRISREATCAAAGERVRVCSVCGALETEPIHATAHQLTAQIVDPDCLNDGYTIERCAVCGWTSGKSDIVPRSALYHAWGEFAEVSPAGCETDGEQVRVCEVCGAVHRQAIPALGHEVVEAVVEPTAESDGYTVGVCARCGMELTDRYDFKPALLFAEERLPQEVDSIPAAGMAGAELLVSEQGGSTVLMLHAGEDGCVSVRADEEWFAAKGVDFVTVESRGLTVRFAPQAAAVRVRETDGAYTVRTSLFTDGFSAEHGAYSGTAYTAPGAPDRQTVLCGRFLCVTAPAGAVSVTILQE